MPGSSEGVPPLGKRPSAGLRPPFRKRVRRIGKDVRFQHPGRIIAASFAVAVLTGSVLLSLPPATASGRGVAVIDVVSTATSAVCVTGLVTVETGAAWSWFGQLVILALIQVGGLGIMTLATLVVVVVSRRLGLRASLIAQAQTRVLALRDVRRVVRNVTVFSLGSEALIAAVLVVRLATAYDMTGSAAAYEAVFHAVSAFNNAGFALYPDSLARYVGDPWVLLPIAAAVIVGGLGFPVLFELARSWRRPRSWSVTTRITVSATVPLLLAGTVVLLALERDNPGTLGPLPGGEKLLAGFFSAVMPRSAGFSAIDVAAMRSESWLVIDVLMFIGGGSAGTAGGVRVTTFGLLAMVLWAEIRGAAHVNIGVRRVAESNQRQALAVALLGIALVLVTTFVVLCMTDHGLDVALFEAVSAVATVGLSTGVTGGLPAEVKALLVALMFVGRIGPLTVASALALRQRSQRFAYPEESAIVG